MRFSDFDVVTLGHRIAQLISFGASKKDVVDKLRTEGVPDDHIRFGWAAAEIVLKQNDACIYCGSTTGFERGEDGWYRCRNCGGV